MEVVVVEYIIVGAIGNAAASSAQSKCAGSKRGMGVDMDSIGVRVYRAVGDTVVINVHVNDVAACVDV